MKPMISMKRSEIWQVNLDPSIGQEIQKTRPCVIVNDDLVGILSLKVIVPLTEWKERYQAAAWMVRIEADSVSGLTKLSAADCFQLRSLSTARLVKKTGELSETEMNRIETALKVVLKINM